MYTVIFVYDVISLCGIYTLKMKNGNVTERYDAEFA